MAPSFPTYSLQLRAQGTRAFYEVMFRIGGRQVKRRVGPAWVTPDGKPRRGAPQDGFLDVAGAHDRAREIVAEQAARAAGPQASGQTFREVALDYMRWLERVKGAKPSTLADHGYALAESNGTTSGQVMLALGGRPAAEVTPRDVENLLDTLAASGASPRTINKRRALLGAVFTYGVKRAGLPGNPVRATDKRREPPRAALATYSVAEVERLAPALSEGRHRDRRAASDATRAEDAQDAELVRVAAYTGLRQGELRALRWRDVGEDVITVSRALSAGVESGTKAAACDTSRSSRRRPRPWRACAHAAISPRLRSSCSATGAGARLTRARSSPGSSARATPSGCARSASTTSDTPTARCSRPAACQSPRYRRPWDTRTSKRRRATCPLARREGRSVGSRGRSLGRRLTSITASRAARLKRRCRPIRTEGSSSRAA
jgi:integrase